MTRPQDDEFDNLLRNHFAAELDPLRGDAARAFERHVTQPMQRRLRLNTVLALGRQVQRCARHAAPMLLTMAACCALGFYVPRWLATPSTTAGHEIAESNEAADLGPTRLADFEQSVTVRHEDRGAAALPDGTPGRRIVQSQVESARYVDPRTNARTEIYLFPAGQETIVPADRQ
ncbi:MAG: hypothetical protein QM754_04990 [Tepidisphaeraceae bacterium]